MKLKCLAIITARGGSKRIPKKNIKNFLGSPIIKYSIEAALNSNCFEEVMVSTDDQDIAKIAKKYGAKVPFFRSKKNSDDHATTAEVILEVINEYKKIGEEFNFACCIYPTAPFITDQKLKKAFSLLKKNNADSVIPVVRFSYPIQRALKIKGHKLKMIQPENLNVMSQNLEPAFHDCGQFYFLNVPRFKKQKRLFMKNTVPFEMPESEVQDIDNFEDWKIAELKYKILEKLV